MRLQLPFYVQASELPLGTSRHRRYALSGSGAYTRSSLRRTYTEASKMETAMSNDPLGCNKRDRTVNNADYFCRLFDPVVQFDDLLL